jgi:phosphoribosyl 1,2-cyclic phosphate phosphodiesterase
VKLTVLGSGTSHGIPVLACPCPVCTSPDPRDTRFRASLYVQGSDGERVVIDTGPEFRLQALRAQITWLDAVLLTHSHADHLHGLDDVRPLCRERYLPVYGNEPTIEELRLRFSYIFRKTQYGGGKPLIRTELVSAPVHIGNLTFTPVPTKHGNVDVLGWLISETSPTRETPCALYLTDTSELPDASRQLIRGAASVCIIGALRELPHPTHFSFEQAITVALETGASRIGLTHICHAHSHSEIEAYCLQRSRALGLEGIHIWPAWDMLEVEL